MQAGDCLRYFSKLPRCFAPTSPRCVGNDLCLTCQAETCTECVGYIRARVDIDDSHLDAWAWLQKGHQGAMGVSNTTNSEVDFEPMTCQATETGGDECIGHGYALCLYWCLTCWATARVECTSQKHALILRLCSTCRAMARDQCMDEGHVLRLRWCSTCEGMARGMCIDHGHALGLRWCSNCRAIASDQCTTQRHDLELNWCSTCRFMARNECRVQDHAQERLDVDALGFAKWLQRRQSMVMPIGKRSPAENGSSVYHDLPETINRLRGLSPTTDTFITGQAPYAEPSAEHVGRARHSSDTTDALLFAQPTDTGIGKYSEEYNMSHRRRGIAVVLNQKSIRKHATRFGTELDVDELVQTFLGLGFDIHSICVLEDQPLKSIFDILKILREHDFSQDDCLCITILSHGNNSGVLLANDYSYNFKSMWKQFTADRCPSLAGKPKLFFVQACRGNEKDPGSTVTDSTSNSDYKIPTHADFLMAYSTVEGTVSWRNKSFGSWFIQSLCSELQKNSGKDDLLTMLTNVSRNVAIEYESISSLDDELGYKQVPSFSSTLIRRIYFRYESNGSALLDSGLQAPRRRTPSHSRYCIPPGPESGAVVEVQRLQSPGRGLPTSQLPLGAASGGPVNLPYGLNRPSLSVQPPLARLSLSRTPGNPDAEQMPISFETGGPRANEAEAGWACPGPIRSLAERASRHLNLPTSLQCLQWCASGACLSLILYLLASTILLFK